MVCSSAAMAEETYQHALVYACIRLASGFAHWQGAQCNGGVLGALLYAVNKTTLLSCGGASNTVHDTSHVLIGLLGTVFSAHMHALRPCMLKSVVQLHG